jgi:tRNA (guanine-N7-)-methyltransferase
MPLPRSQYYGRRSARRLTGSRIEVLKTALAKHELRLPEADDAMLPAQPAPLWLEIGFGSGEHLLALAKAHPDTQFIGCEPFLNGVAALVRTLEADGVRNVRIFPEDARLLLARLPDSGVARCYVLFADPWPKARHNRRRIVNPETLEQFARVLAPGGALYLATDHPDLAAWYEEVIAAHPAFEWHAASGEDAFAKPPDWPPTRYETKALIAGRRPRYYRVSRRESGQASG